MRIVHVDTGREFRGGQRQALMLARGLAGRGYSQVILGRSLGAEAARRGLPARRLNALALVKEARSADVVHAHDARAHTLAALAAPDRPLVVSRRVAFPVGAGVLSRWKYDRATRFLAVSEFVKGRLVEAGVNPEQISVVYDGVELPAAAPVARQPFVLAPETDDPQKGSALAIEACCAAGVELRFSRDLESDLPRASLFLYLTHSEGLGSAILLAMAHGTPVVASRVGGIPEIVEHAKTGLLVENSPPAVASAVREALADPRVAAQRAAAALAQVTARFTDAIMVAHTEQAYRLALSTK